MISGVRKDKYDNNFTTNCSLNRKSFHGIAMISGVRKDKYDNNFTTNCSLNRKSFN